MSKPDFVVEFQLEQIVPIVLSRFHHEIPILQTTSDFDADSLRAQLAFVELGEHLAVTVGQRDAHGYRQMTHQQLKSIHLNLHQAVEMARENLVRQNGLFCDGGQFQQIRPGLWILQSNGYEQAAAGVLFVERIARLSLRGDPVAIVPNSHCLLVTGSADVDSLPEFLRLARDELVRDNQPISVAPLILKNGRWQAWHPQDAHPACQSVRSIYQFDQSTNYGEQAELLQPNLLARQVDIHVATYRMMEVITDEHLIENYSLAVWTDSVDTLLPKADVVGILPLLNRSELENGQASQPEFGELVFVEWNRFEQIVAGELEETRYYPRRYRIRSALTNEQWSIIRANEFKFSREFMDALGEVRLERQDAASPVKRTDVFPFVAAGIATLIIAIVGFVLVGIFMLRSMLPKNPQPAVIPQLPNQLEEFPEVKGLEPAENELETIDWNGEKLIKSTLAGSERKPFYTDVAPQDGVLVGMRLTKGKNWGGAIRAIQPIYQVKNQNQNGTRHGLPGGNSQHRVVAKPGYAVGGLVVRAGLVMNAIQLEFHRNENGVLDPEDSYRSEWIGCEGGRLFDPITSNGKPVRGISGSYIDDQLGIRLLYAGDQNIE